MTTAVFLPHQCWVIEERSALAEKLEKLSSFLMTKSARELDGSELMLLFDQREIMKDYLDILDKRIALW